MARLVVVRPVASNVFAAPACHILIDGRRAATLAAGMRTEVPLPPGHHEVSARMGFMRSPIFPVECDPETTLCLGVVFRPFLDLPGWLTLMLYAIAPVIVLGIEGVHDALVADVMERVWFNRFLQPFTFLGFAVAGAMPVVTRYGWLRFETMPAVDPASGRVALPVAPPRRVRITVRGLMIAVATLALLLGFGVHRWRTLRGDDYRRLALQHADLERNFRESAERLRASSARLRASSIPEVEITLAGRAAMSTRADYHAAMRRKYEEAAARGAMTVEPDPPEPPEPP